MNAEAQDEKIEAENAFGNIDEDGLIAGGFGKYVGMPWYLAYWFANGYADEEEGTIDDIGFHGLFRITDEQRAAYSPDIPKEDIGYIVRTNDHGFVTYESYEDEEDLRKAWESVEKASEKFFTCEACRHVNYRNGDGCQVDNDDDACTCQECEGNCPHERTRLDDGISSCLDCGHTIDTDAEEEPE